MRPELNSREGQLDSHDKLRSVENDIYIRIEDIKKKEDSSKDKVTSKALAVFAILISIASVLIPIYSEKTTAIEMAKVAEIVFDKRFIEINEKDPEPSKNVDVLK